MLIVVFDIKLTLYGFVKRRPLESGMNMEGDVHGLVLIGEQYPWTKVTLIKPLGVLIRSVRKTLISPDRVIGSVDILEIILLSDSLNPERLDQSSSNEVCVFSIPESRELLVHS
jgi:hypothetical protein